MHNRVKGSSFEKIFVKFIFKKSCVYDSILLINVWLYKGKLLEESKKMEGEEQLIEEHKQFIAKERKRTRSPPKTKEEINQILKELEKYEWNIEV